MDFEDLPELDRLRDFRAGEERRDVQRRQPEKVFTIFFRNLLLYLDHGRSKIKLTF